MRRWQLPGKEAAVCSGEGRCCLYLSAAKNSYLLKLNIYICASCLLGKYGCVFQSCASACVCAKQNYFMAFALRK